MPLRSITRLGVPSIYPENVFSLKYSNPNREILEEVFNDLCSSQVIDSATNKRKRTGSDSYDTTGFDYFKDCEKKAELKLSVKNYPKLIKIGDKLFFTEDKVEIFGLASKDDGEVDMEVLTPNSPCDSRPDFSNDSSFVGEGDDCLAETVKKPPSKPVSEVASLLVKNFIPELKTCFACQKHFTEVVHLRDHCKSRWSSTNSFTCCAENCQYQGTFADAWRHVKDTHFDSTKQCKFCWKVEANAEMKAEHEKAHAEEKRYGPFSCQRCDYRTHLASDHVRHLIKAHLCYPDIEHVMLSPDKSRCNVCLKEFQNDDEIRQHIAFWKKEKKCCKCNYTASGVNKIKKHMYSHLGFNEFQCTQCDKSFAKMRYYKQHLLIHDGDSTGNKYYCKPCKRLFLGPYLFNQHIMSPSFKECHEDAVATGRAPPWRVCEECDKKFGSNQQLEDHKRQVHLGSNNLKCDVCDKTFSFRHCLKRHMRIHTDQRAYGCSGCGKHFKTTFEWKAEAFHASCRKIMNVLKDCTTCVVCRIDFGNIKNLRRHERNRFNLTKESFECCGCKTVFNEAGSLSEHLDEHRKFES